MAFSGCHPEGVTGHLLLLMIPYGDALNSWAMLAPSTGNKAVLLGVNT